MQQDKRLVFIVSVSRSARVMLQGIFWRTGTPKRDFSKEKFTEIKNKSVVVTFSNILKGKLLQILRTKPGFLIAVFQCCKTVVFIIITSSPPCCFTPTKFRTNGKDSRVRLRTSPRTIGEDGLKT